MNWKLHNGHSVLISSFVPLSTSGLPTAFTSISPSLFIFSTYQSFYESICICWACHSCCCCSMILTGACSEGLSSDPAAGLPGWGIWQDTGRIDHIRGALLVSHRARELVFFHSFNWHYSEFYHAAEILANSLVLNWAKTAALNSYCTIQNSLYLPAFENSKTFLDGWPFSVATVPFSRPCFTNKACSSKWPLFLIWKCLEPARAKNWMKKTCCIFNSHVLTRQHKHEYCKADLERNKWNKNKNLKCRD